VAKRQVAGQDEQAVSRKDRHHRDLLNGAAFVAGQGQRGVGNRLIGRRARDERQDFQRVAPLQKITDIGAPGIGGDDAAVRAHQYGGTWTPGDQRFRGRHGGIPFDPSGSADFPLRINLSACWRGGS